MRRREFFGRWCTLVIGLYLVLLLPGADAWASEVQDTRPVVVSAGTSSPPDAMDCMPCARCYVAPAPSAQAFSGEGNAPEAPARGLHAVQFANSDGWFDTGGARAWLPLRIAYCRWRN